jgi:oligopeptide/dipeptide ABC transporter ATP-binding protein
VTAAPLLEVAGLAVAFPTRRGPLMALDGVSYTLEAGRTLGIVGESGSGKTMLALAILGLLPRPGAIVGGAVRFAGETLSALDEPALGRIRGDRIAMVFQEPMTALNPVLTVGEQIAEVLRRHRGLDRRAAWDGAVAALARVGIPSAAARARDYPHRLSGGQRQRAMIAMALACRPALLIADEPTTALDVTVQAQILELMLEIQAELGMAIQFVSHDMAVISEVADEVAVVYAGRIVETAPVDELLAEPLHPYSRALIASIPRIGRGQPPAGIPGQMPGPLERPAGCRYSDRCPLADAGCRAAEPALEAVAPGRAVACFKAGAPFEPRR